jgi:hypothetical protein
MPKGHCFRAVRKVRPLDEKFWRKVGPENESGCRLWLASCDSRGYGHIWDKGKLRIAHRVAWELTNGPIPDGLWVLHRCDVRRCVNPAHLFLGTHDDNMHDMVRKGRHVPCLGDKNGARTHPERLARGDRRGPRKHKDRMPRGEDHFRTTLTNKDVLAIRTKFTYGHKKLWLAKEYGVGWSTIDRIIRREVWTHI